MQAYSCLLLRFMAESKIFWVVSSFKQHSAAPQPKRKPCLRFISMTQTSSAASSTIMVVFHNQCQEELNSIFLGNIL